MSRIHTVWMHIKPHLDEICAFWLLVRFGEKMFPGIGDCELRFTANGGIVSDQKTADMEAQGHLFLGCGDEGARFNDHRGGVKKKCTAELVAETLGLSSKDEIKLMLDYVHKADLGTGMGPFEFASLIKMKHNLPNGDTEEVVRWAMAVLDEIHQDQYLFWSEANIELAKLQCRHLTEWSIIYIDGVDSPRVLRAVRANVEKCAVFIQRTKTGNVQIFCTDQHRLKFRLHWVAGELRRLEDLVRYGKVRCEDAAKRMAVGKLDDSDPWYLMEGKTKATTGVMLLNGSLTHSDVSPTRLGLEEIVDVVEKSLDYYLERKRKRR